MLEDDDRTDHGDGLLSAPQYVELCSLDIDLYQRWHVVVGKHAVERLDAHRDQFG